MNQPLVDSGVYVSWLKNSEAFHRDIKGPNILLDKNGPLGEPY